MFNDYKVTYTLRVEAVNNDHEEHPDQSIELCFDGTDRNLHVVLSQVETFLKAAGYHFDHLEVVR